MIFHIDRYFVENRKENHYGSQQMGRPRNSTGTT